MDQDKRPETGALTTPVPALVSRQIVWLMTLRVVVVTTLLLSALLVQSITDAYFIELNPVYYLVGFTYLLTLVYAGIHALGRWRRGFLYGQLIGDLLTITGLIYVSGGIDSAFPFLYILTIITASILLMRRGGVIMALCACVLYGALVALIYNRVVAPATGFLASPTLTMNQVYYNLFVRWIGFIAAALLSSYLAEKLHETGETLKERSEDLEKLQVFYEDIINSVNSGLLSTNLLGRVGSLNHAGQQILGKPFAAVRGRFLDDVLAFDGGTRDRMLDVGPDGLRLDLRYATPAGALRHLGISVSRLYDRQNLHRGFTCVFQDLTMLKELEREVRLKERMAAVGEMAAGIAHEIRNPLASMSGSIQVLKGDLQLEGEQMTLMDIVLSESDRLNRIIEEFLFYARPSMPVPQPVDLAVLVEQTVALFRNSRELKPEHELEWTSEARNPVVEADPGQLRQVLWNLLRNASQAMPEGGRLRVRVGPEERLGVALSVDDEGPGFRDEEPEHYWEPFHTSKTKGTGLGLAIVYRIVRDHGGRVSLTNRAPRGARVTLWFPRVWDEPLGVVSPAASGAEQRVP